MVARRRRASEGPSWASRFVPADWPGRCDVERFEAWRSALNEDPARMLATIVLQRATRHRVEAEHVECAAHPPQTFYPSSWNRTGATTLYTVAWSDGSSTVEDVENGSKRDQELLAAATVRQAAIMPSRPAVRQQQ